jgi:hypothetical protein
MRYLLTLKGRPPFGLAGIEMYQRFREIANFMEELLTHHHEPSLALIAQGIQSTLTRFASEIFFELFLNPRQIPLISFV